MEFTTPKGTVLPLLDLKGKMYLQVMHRLVWFREEHPDWGLLPEKDTVTDEWALFVTRITDSSGTTVAIAHGQESKKDFKDYIEKAETKSIGRALTLCGYGTQFAAPDLDEGDRIVDSPAPSTKPTQEVQQQAPQQTVQQKLQNFAKKTTLPPGTLKPELGLIEITFGKWNGKTIETVLATDGKEAMYSYRNYLLDSVKKTKKELSEGAKYFVEAVNALEFELET